MATQSSVKNLLMKEDLEFAANLATMDVGDSKLTPSDLLEKLVREDLVKGGMDEDEVKAKMDEQFVAYSGRISRERWARILKEEDMLADEQHLPGDISKGLLLDGLREMRVGLEIQKLGLQKIECAVAGSDFEDIAEVIKENFKPIVETIKPPEEKKMEPIRVTGDDNKRAYRCPVCGFQKASRSTVLGHMIDIHGLGSQLECPRCYHTSSSRDAMSKHIKVCKRKDKTVAEAETIEDSD